MNSLVVNEALELLTFAFEQYSKPIIMSSFGKDSMVLLDLAERALGKKLPILFHREPFLPKKNQFADRIIAERGYTVFDYAPAGFTLFQNNGRTDIVRHYNVAKGKFAMLPLNIYDGDTMRGQLCGLDDFYHRPTSPVFEFPWDLVLIGHKSSDVDPTIGPVPLKVDLHKNVGGPDYLFPLRHFTHQDIWDYTFGSGLPYNTERYDGDLQDLPMKKYNNDYYPVCVRCMDRTQPAVVRCPKLNRDISNISKEIVYTSIDVGYIDNEQLHGSSPERRSDGADAKAEEPLHRSSPDETGPPKASRPGLIHATGS